MESTKDFDYGTYYFNIEFEIEDCTIHSDISTITEDDFLSFKEEYSYYKNTIVQTLKNFLYKSIGNNGSIKKVTFQELNFKHVLNRAVLKTFVSIDILNEYKNLHLSEGFKPHLLFSDLLITIVRVKAPHIEKKARFITLFKGCIGNQSSQDKQYIKDIILAKNETKVVNVKVKYIRNSIPRYHNLKEWMKDPNNVYIGRRAIVFIDGERYPKKDSIWSNPFKVSSNNPVEMCCDKYREYITQKLDSDENLVKELLSLKGKNLGCWCKTDSASSSASASTMCHGDVLIELIKKYEKF